MVGKTRTENEQCREPMNVDDKTKIIGIVLLASSIALILLGSAEIYGTQQYKAGYQAGVNDSAHVEVNTREAWQAFNNSIEHAKDGNRSAAQQLVESGNMFLWNLWKTTNNTYYKDRYVAVFRSCIIEPYGPQCVPVMQTVMDDIEPRSDLAEIRRNRRQARSNNTTN